MSKPNKYTYTLAVATLNAYILLGEYHTYILKLTPANRAGLGSAGLGKVVKAIHQFRAATAAKDAKDWSLPSFGSHLNPISTRGGRLCPPYTGVLGWLKFAVAALILT